MDNSNYPLDTNLKYPTKNDLIDYKTPLQEINSIIDLLAKTSLTQEQNKYILDIKNNSKVLELKITQTISQIDNINISANKLKTDEEISLKGKNIVLVKDNSKLHDKIKEYLLDEECNIEEVDSDDDAIRLLLSCPKDRFELVIAPIGKSMIDGYKLAAILKSMPSTNHIPVVLWICEEDNVMPDNIDELDISSILPLTLEQNNIAICVKNIFNLDKKRNHFNQENQENQETQISEVLQKVEYEKDTKEHNNLVKKILIVEDGFINKKLVTSFLKNKNIPYDLVENGLDALNICKNNEYAMVFMDCQMPVMDGYESTKSIRKFEGCDKHTFIVAMTANAMTGDREKCLAAGMDDYISKPINFDEFLKKIEYFTDQKRILQNVRGDLINETSKCSNDKRKCKTGKNSL